MDNKFNGRVTSEIFKDLSSNSDENIKKENEYILEIKCKTPNEDKFCKSFYTIFNKTILDDLNINFPIKLRTTTILSKGDEFGIKRFNLSGITDLINEYYPPQTNNLSLLVPEIYYLEESVIPYLKLNVHEIIEYSTIINDDVYNELFDDWDNTNEEWDDSNGFDNELFFSKNSVFIHDILELVDYVKVEYECGILNKKRRDYVKNLINSSSEFENILLIPILPIEKNTETGKIVVKSPYKLIL
jgi:hypothetical protein